MDCLRGLVGLVKDQSANNPLPEEWPQDYRASSVGLWAGNLVGPMILGDAHIDPLDEQDSIWGALVDAYESALLQLPQELAGFLGFRMQPAFSNFTGRIGEVSTTGIVAVQGSRAGYALPTRNLKGGALTITGLGLMLNTSVTDLPITLTRYNGPVDTQPSGSLGNYLGSPYLASQPGEVLKVWEMDVSVADSRSYAVTPIQLPLDGSIYVISYPVNGLYYPLNNRLSCGCGGKHDGLNATLTTPIGSINGDNAHGLLLDVKTTCDFTGVVCDLLLNNQYTAAIGYLLYFKTALNVLADLRGGKLSPAIQVRKEDLDEKRTEWEAEMNKYLTWMTTEWEPGLLPPGRCYVCNKSGNLYRGTLTL